MFKLTAQLFGLAELVPVDAVTTADNMVILL